MKICIDNIIALCKEYFKPSKQDIATINDHIIQCDSLKVMKLLSEYDGQGKIVFWHYDKASDAVETGGEDAA